MTLFDRMDRVMLVLGGFALAVIVVVTTVDVLSANVRGRPLTGVYEVVEVALVFVVFLGMPEIFRTERNIAVDVIDNFVGAKAVRRLRTTAAALSALFLAVMVFCMATPAIESWKFSDAKADTGIPVWLIWVPVMIGMGLAVVSAIAACIRHFRSPNTGEAPQ